jgi:hypothetical protein
MFSSTRKPNGSWMPTSPNASSALTMRPYSRS